MTISNAAPDDASRASGPRGLRSANSSRSQALQSGRLNGCFKLVSGRHVTGRVISEADVQRDQVRVASRRYRGFTVTESPMASVARLNIRDLAHNRWRIFVPVNSPESIAMLYSSSRSQRATQLLLAALAVGSGDFCLGGTFL